MTYLEDWKNKNNSAILVLVGVYPTRNNLKWINPVQIPLYLKPETWEILQKQYTRHFNLSADFKKVC